MHQPQTQPLPALARPPQAQHAPPQAPHALQAPPRAVATLKPRQPLPPPPSQNVLQNQMQNLLQQPRQPHAATPLYPAIAIKPKPIALLPPTHTSQFDPTPLKTSLQLNVNTSRKWVLPPRPRPGRKPAEDEKRARRDLQQLPPAAAQPAPPPAHSPTKKVKAAGGAGAAASLTQSLATMRTLKQYYLAKIREQELVKNYIDVINKQIKELRFVQNGVITFDALNEAPTARAGAASGAAGGAAAQSTLTPLQVALTLYEQLERINNMNDLNKFLGYLTKLTNVIHSVTKHYSTTDESLDRQIALHLEAQRAAKRARPAVEPRAAAATVAAAELPLKAIEEDYDLEELLGDDLLAKPPRAKAGCGFCSNGSPCLCLEADLEIGTLR